MCEGRRGLIFLSVLDSMPEEKVGGRTADTGSVSLTSKSTLAAGTAVDDITTMVTTSLVVDCHDCVRSDDCYDVLRLYELCYICNHVHICVR